LPESFRRHDLEQRFAYVTQAFESAQRTMRYACNAPIALEARLGRYAQAARAAQRSGLGVNAGHDLNLDNLPVFLRSVPKVLEVSIGHALISDALELGLAEAVRRYVEAIRRGNTDQGKRAP